MKLRFTSQGHCCKFDHDLFCSAFLESELDVYSILQAVKNNKTNNIDVTKLEENILYFSADIFCKVINKREQQLLPVHKSDQEWMSFYSTTVFDKVHSKFYQVLDESKSQFF